MGFFQWITGWSKDERVEDWAETVAARSFDAIWESVRERAAMLSGATLRGYIRARGGEAIRSEIERVETFVGAMSQDARRRVFESTLDDLTRRVMLRSVSTRRAVPMRRAA